MAARPHLLHRLAYCEGQQACLPTPNRASTHLTALKEDTCINAILQTHDFMWTHTLTRLAGGIGQGHKTSCRCCSTAFMLAREVWKVRVCVCASNMLSLNLQPHPGPTSQRQLQAIHCRLLKKVQLTQLSPCLFIATHMLMPSPCLANVGPSHWVELLHDRWLSPSVAISPPSRGASAQAAPDNLHCHLHQGICVSRPPCSVPSAWAEQGPCSPDGTVLLPGPGRHPIIRG